MTAPLRTCSVISGALLLLATGAAAQSLSEAAAPTQGAAPRPPRLVLQITVDQLRGDLLRRGSEHWGEGGFRRLLEGGAVFANAHHAHANTETVVGHATLATGAHPATHGMVGNLWMDRASGEAQYNVEDAEHPVLSSKPLVDADTEIDPTQRAARSDGRSPRALLVSTFGDELALFSGGRSKVFGVSVKDRGAITLAGHSGTAYWFSKSTGEFVTSDFYAQAYPAWVGAWNAKRAVERYAGTSWELLASAESYLFGERDDRPYETALPGFGRVFPHAYGAADGKYFTTFLTLSPAGDELTLDFAKELVRAEGLGADDVPDYLSVSFSSTDYVGHIFGPSSLEAEDNLRRLDRSLADLFAFVDDRVGLENTLVVLSADHGGPEAPDYLRSMGHDANYIANADELEEALHQALSTRFGLGQDAIQGFFHPYVYLNRAVIEGVADVDEVAEFVADELGRMPGIAQAFSSAAMLAGEFADTRVSRSVLNNLNPIRSGEVYVVTRPDHFVNDFDGLTVAATHGSPWRYDTHVPVIFMGAGIEPQVVQREVFTVDVAASLAALLGTKPPSGCEGAPLLELFR